MFEWIFRSKKFLLLHLSIQYQRDLFELIKIIGNCNNMAIKNWGIRCFHSKQLNQTLGIHHLKGN